MELGALICEPSDPKCEQCPLLAVCVAGNSPDPSALPELPPNRATIAVTHSSALVRNPAGDVLIVQRPLHGLWGGLWEFPRVVCASGETPQEGAARAAREVAGLEVQVGAEDRQGETRRHPSPHHALRFRGGSLSTRTPLRSRWPVPLRVGRLWTRSTTTPFRLRRSYSETHCINRPLTIKKEHVQPTLLFDE